MHGKAYGRTQPSTHLNGFSNNCNALLLQNVDVSNLSGLLLDITQLQRLGVQVHKPQSLINCHVCNARYLEMG